jgi:exo-beta-1,3-glucanase (GH17 family)
MQMSRIDFRTVRRSVQESRLSARPTIFPSGRQAVNIMRSVSSIFAASRRLAALGLCLGLAACGSSQNWQDNSQFVTVGGNVAGFTGGSLAVWNNGGDRLAIADNGSFTFSLKIASGSTYSVVVATQPAGQNCTVSNGSGTARSDVTSVTVNCVPYTFTRRPLPAIYTTGKAINYSPYRTEGGPITSEVPSDLDILQDLTLLNTAGFNLLRLFGAKAPATDVVAEKILRIAAQTFPDMKFQLGLDLKGLTSCSDPANDFNIAYLISNLSKYPNVVTISVGNETSFFSKFMPLPCLEGYIRTIRAQVPQPVTSDDDWTFYAGLSGGGGDRVPVKPDTILPLIDFASIHMYPISYTADWDWRQTSVPEGQERAQAMMEESLATLKRWHGEVVDYQYVGADGVRVSVGDSMPVTVGETGWKARQTNPALEIETFAAREANQKWYVDLLYGNPGGYESWQGSAGGPPMIFYFQGYDEQWKGIDDGWGLWNIDRQARYALCGTPAGPACNDDLYEGAGYFIQSNFSTITFDSPDINYSFIDFGGTGGSGVVADPIGGANKVARVIRSDAAVIFAGTVVGTSGDTVGIIPFDADNTRMTVRVYAPAAGIPVRLKLQRSQDDPNDPSNKVETEVLTTVANGWETLTFDFASQVPGTPPLNTSLLYDQLVIFFNFGKTGAEAGVQTFYYDDITFIGGGGTGGGGGGALVNGVFADDYVGDLPATAKSVQGGDVGFFSDPRLAAAYSYGGVAGSAVDPGGVPNFYYGLGLNAPAITDAYFGAFVKSPGNGTVDLSGYTNILVNVWGPDQLFQAGTFPALDVILQGPAVSGCGSPSGGSEVHGTFNTTGQGAAQVYTVPLSSFTLTTACSGETTVAQVLASITQVNILLKNTNIQYVNKDPDGVAFTNGLNVGSIKFN